MEKYWPCNRTLVINVMSNANGSSFDSNLQLFPWSTIHLVCRQDTFANLVVAFFGGVGGVSKKT